MQVRSNSLALTRVRFIKLRRRLSPAVNSAATYHLLDNRPDISRVVGQNFVHQGCRRHVAIDRLAKTVYEHTPVAVRSDSGTRRRPEHQSPSVNCFTVPEWLCWQLLIWRSSKSPRPDDRTNTNRFRTSRNQTLFADWPGEPCRCDDLTQ